MNEVFSLLDDPTQSKLYQAEPAQIAGFWRRLLAFLIDCLILGVIGLVIGSILFDTFTAMGGWGRLVGFAIALAYFGTLNSWVGGGQTAGKRLVNVKVVDSEGGSISLHRSYARYVVLGTPYFLNGAMIATPVPLLIPIISVVIFGAGFAILYLYVFNRRTRQSLHDIAAGTLVVRATDVEPPPPVHIWKYHIVIASAAVVLMLVALVSTSIFVAQSFGLSDLAALQERIHESEKVHFASVFAGKVWAGADERSYLKIDAVWRNKPDSYELAASEIAAIAIRDYPDVSNKDALVVNIIYGFDIGIASGWQSYSFAHTPDEWKRMLE